MGRHGTWSPPDELRDSAWTHASARTHDSARTDHFDGIVDAAQGSAHLPDPRDLRIDDLIEQVLAHDPRVEDRGIEGVPATFSWWEETPAEGLALGLVDRQPSVPLEWAPPSGWDRVRPDDALPPDFSWWDQENAPSYLSGPADSSPGDVIPWDPTPYPAGRANPYASPQRGRAVPSRRELRERERAQGTARAVLGRRLAKGGVLAVTALGVVAATAPHGAALGHLLDRMSAGGVGNRAMAQLAVPALAMPSDRLEGARLQVEQNVASAIRATAAAKAEASTAVQASAAAKEVARQALVVAAQQARVAEVARQAELDRASRDAQRDPQSYARLMVENRGWSATEYSCLNRLWNRESTWNYRATNPSSGAYGIPQALPGSRMSSVASDWRTNPVTQMTWGLNYIADRYGTPCGAWAHSQATGWY